MTRADQLRQALDIIDAENAHEQISGYVTEESPIINAARFALKVWEGDEQLVAQMAKALAREKPQTPYWRAESDRLARVALAAITEGSGE